MSSTAVELGLINSFRTGNVVIDTLACMLIPLLIQKVVTAVNAHGSIFSLISSYFFASKTVAGVTRTIEITQRYNQYGKVWDYEQKNHLLQKAISIYLSEILDLNGKSGVYELLENPKKSADRAKSIGCNDSDSGSTTGSSSYDDSEDSDWDDDDGYGNASVNKLSVEILPQMNEWIRVEEGVLFMHSIDAPGASGESKSKMKEERVIFKFYSTLEDGSDRIDAFINRAFTNYQQMEKEKHAKDKSRYFYIQSGGDVKPKEGDDGAAASTVVAYKRYALGEDKTFANLFFDGKQQVLQLLDNFTTRSGKFAIKGFPYKLGLLLHGPPGTGKTSLIKAIAQYTKRHIVTISLAKIKTNQELMDAVFDLKFAVQGLDSPVQMTFEDVVFVMEDIDCASSVVNARKAEDLTPKDISSKDDIPKLVDPVLKPKDKSDRLNLSGLLNVLDGVIDCPGRIVIMTTNHPEKLDPALIRPGRVNKKLLLSHMGVPQIQEMIEYYCMIKFTPEQTKALDEVFTATDQKFTPAEIEEFCAEYDDVDTILAQFTKDVAKAPLSSAAY
uniref:AAA+ ATPase domain-containing protein n=1 Tax=Globisporangium ultimum (strain ATCC 200006 / CBS 805.95 / DAOM BR144) TaxID=431595 RepID=K3WXX9_GLOUD